MKYFTISILLVVIFLGSGCSQAEPTTEIYIPTIDTGKFTSDEIEAMVKRDLSSLIMVGNEDKIESIKSTTGFYKGNGVWEGNSTLIMEGYKTPFVPFTLSLSPTKSTATPPPTPYTYNFIVNWKFYEKIQVTEITKTSSYEVPLLPPRLKTTTTTK